MQDMGSIITSLLKGKDIDCSLLSLTSTNFSKTVVKNIGVENYYLAVSTEAFINEGILKNSPHRKT